MNKSRNNHSSKKRRKTSFDLTQMEEERIFKSLCEELGIDMLKLNRIKKEESGYCKKSIEENLKKEKFRTNSLNLNSNQRKLLRIRLIQAEIKKREDKISKKKTILSKSMTKILKMVSPKKDKYYKSSLRHYLIPEEKVNDDEYKNILCYYLREKLTLEKKVNNYISYNKFYYDKKENIIDGILIEDYVNVNKKSCLKRKINNNPFVLEKVNEPVFKKYI